VCRDGGEEILGRKEDCFLQKEVTQRLEEIIDVLGEIKTAIQNVTVEEYFWTVCYLLDSYFFFCGEGCGKEASKRVMRA